MRPSNVAANRARHAAAMAAAGKRFLTLQSHSPQRCGSSRWDTPGPRARRTTSVPALAIGSRTSELRTVLFADGNARVVGGSAPHSLARHSPRPPTLTIATIGAPLRRGEGSVTALGP